MKKYLLNLHKGLYINEGFENEDFIELLILLSNFYKYSIIVRRKNSTDFVTFTIYF